MTRVYNIIKSSSHSQSRIRMQFLPSTTPSSQHKAMNRMIHCHANNKYSYSSSYLPVLCLLNLHQEKVHLQNQIKCLHSTPLMNHKNGHKLSSLPPSSSFSTAVAATTTTTTATNDTTQRKIQPFLLTDIGEGITEVELIQWYVQPNQKIQQFDKVCEVQSDKATVEITSRYDGIVHDLNNYNVGDMIPVGQPLLFISMEDIDGGGSGGGGNHDNYDDIRSSSGGSVNTRVANNTHPSRKSITRHQVVDNLEKKREMIAPIGITTTPSSSHSTTSNNSNNVKPRKVLATPAVRKLGKDFNLDLSLIQGNGPNGRVLKEDVLRGLGFMDSGNQNKVDAVGVNGINIEGNEHQPSSSASKNGNTNEVIPIRGYHRLMVNSMTTTLQVPHMTYSDEVEMSSLIQCRHDINQTISKNKSHPLKKLSYLPFLVKACSLALKEYPILNSSIDVNEMNIILHSRHDIGIAMDSDRGLVVPVVRGCEDLSIMDIALELNRLRDLAMKGALTEKDLVHPTFTLSNIGSIGGTIMSPVILPPQVAIGAVGKIQRLPRFVDDKSMEVQESQIMNISWGGDHRVVDGATLGKFSNVWKSYIESPMMMTFTLK